MSWIDKELKRRAAASRRSAPCQSSTIAASDRIQELRNKLERANAALPSELQLRREQGEPVLSSPVDATLVIAVWLRAGNRAALGFATDGIRYVWPQASRRWSNNFWIRWDAERGRYQLSRRVGTLARATAASYAFDNTRIDYMITRLVMCKRIRVGAVRKKRLGLF